MLQPPTCFAHIDLRGLTLLHIGNTICKNVNTHKKVSAFLLAEHNLSRERVPNFSLQPDLLM